MALEYDGQRIGAMQYNGVTIGEAMIDGQIVYRSVIRVTPTPPTFHDGEPWITLPTVEGVTYSVSGTPGYNASVTVTATAQPGYELVGTASWSHTFSSAYPVSGSWPTRTLSTAFRTESSHTITEPGIYTISHEVTRESGFIPVQSRISGPWGNTVGTQGNTSTALTTQTLAVGQIVNFQAIAGINGQSGSGTWSIVKN